MTDTIDTLIVGAGVIGLAIGKFLSKTHEVFVCEANEQFGMETSSRNSEVIHAGIYYPENFLKTKLCVQGKAFLYDYCAKNHIPHRQCGKLIVATCDEEIDQLATIANRAEKANVLDLQRLSRAEIAEREPVVRAVEGLFSPSTGIIDSHAYMLQLTADIEHNGGVIAYKQEVTKVSHDGTVFEVVINDQDVIRCKHLINAAGLNSQALVKDLLGEEHIPTLHLCKGQYFSYQSASLFTHLVYPVPQKSNTGLGVHATIDLAGQTRFWPRCALH